jgi:hypothetical protein
MLPRLERWADSIRTRFDAIAKNVDAFGVVFILAVLMGISRAIMTALEPKACRAFSFRRILDLELTFSARRYAALLDAIAANGCNSAFLFSLISSDIIFPITNSAMLCCIFIWVERQRRFDPNNVPIPEPVPNRNHVLLLLPLAAGFADIFLENIPLWIAGKAIMSNPVNARDSGIDAIVTFGSLGASLKWSIAALSILSILKELMHNSRGVIIKRLRYSVVAVLLGALPLLMIPQGQDLLQRSVEGEHPWTGIARAVVALTFGGYVVWFCGRKLVQLQFPRDPEDARPDWYDFFGEHIPRILGIAVLALGAAAFARAAGAMKAFLIISIGGFVAAAIAKKFFRRATEALGRALVLEEYRGINDLVVDAARAFIAVIIGAALLRAPNDPPDFKLLRWGAYLLLVMSWLFYLYVYSRRARHVARTLRNALRAAARSKDANEKAKAGALFAAALVAGTADAVSSVDPSKLDIAIKRTVIAGIIVSLVALAAFTFVPVSSARFVGPLIVLSMAVASVVFFGSIATWVHERHGIHLLVIALVLAALFSVWNDSHIVRRVTGSKTDVDERKSLQEALSSRSVDSLSKPIVLVAAAGGGLRAAYWTATTLGALQDSIPEFNRHLFAISAVSGGSVGASVYAALVHDSLANPGKVKCLSQTHSFSGCVREFMAEDYLSPVLAKMVAPDFVQTFLPFPWRQLDRSGGLEGSWENSYYRVTGFQTLDSAFLRLRSDSLAVPALFLNTTHVETGKRYITAPFRVSMHDSQDLLALMGSDMPLSTAAHNSARFTYVSPPGRILRGDTAEYGHVVDGGYFENSGLATLREILDAVQSSDSAAKPIVIYLCNDPVPCRVRPAALPITARSAVIEWVGPIKALLSARDARGSLSRADIAALSKVEFLQLSVCDSLIAADTGKVVALARERVISPPLGWQLSKVARDWMDSSLTDGARSSTCRRQNASAMRNLEAALRH